MKKSIHTEKAPKAIGPYSQAVVFENLLFTSGQLPIKNGELEAGCIRQATQNCLENLKAILEEAGSSLDKVLKVTVFLKNMDDFKEMNEVYGIYFNENAPARSAVEVAKLPLDALVEIEAVAFL